MGGCQGSNDLFFAPRDSGDKIDLVDGNSEGTPDPNLNPYKAISARDLPTIDSSDSQLVRDYLRRTLNLDLPPGKVLLIAKFVDRFEKSQSGQLKWIPIPESVSTESQFDRISLLIQRETAIYNEPAVRLYRLDIDKNGKTYFDLSCYRQERVLRGAQYVWNSRQIQSLWYYCNDKNQSIDEAIEDTAPNYIKALHDSIWGLEGVE